MGPTKGAQSGPPLRLDERLLLGRGQLRACYRHPENPDLVVKIPVGQTRAQLQANHKELKGYQFLLRRHGRLEGVSHCHGLVATTLGEGLLCDCIRDADGTISRTIWDHIHSPDEPDLHLLLAIAGQFCRYLEERDIWLFDLNLKNIALQKQADGAYRPMFLDLKGRYDNNEFIPFSSYLPCLARRKRRRRANQLLSRIRHFHALRHPPPAP